jgi:hypothetical protein
LPPGNGCPTAIPFRHFGEGGGLLICGLNAADTLRRSTSYLDRILRGEKSGELPIQVRILRLS